MSFDLFLVTFHNGKNACADADAARSVLERFRFDHQFESNSYDITFDDGSYLEMFASGLHSDKEGFDGGMIALRCFSDAVGTFIYEFSRAAGCVIFPAMKPASVLLPREDLALHLPADFSKEFKLILIASGTELMAALNDGYDAWLTYRDHVVHMTVSDPAAEM